MSQVNEKPSWIKGKISFSKSLHDVYELKKTLNLHTVCEEAMCPNLGDCWSKKHAAFIAMGDTCTRSCTFCHIKTGKPQPLDPFEPYNIAQAVLKMDLRHVVITSVDRDDLKDGGANHFAKIIECIRNECKNTTIEILTPDFRFQKDEAIKIIMSNPPDIFNHNIETVPSLYRKVRPTARYFNSLSLLNQVKNKNNNVFTKSGFMLGLGETDEEVIQLMDDLRSAQVDFITIGQYLQPTPKHTKVDRYVDPEKFKFFEKTAYNKGFLMVSASPMTRSSYHADQDFAKLKAKKIKMESKSVKN